MCKLLNKNLTYNTCNVYYIWFNTATFLDSGAAFENEKSSVDHVGQKSKSFGYIFKNDGIVWKYLYWYIMWDSLAGKVLILYNILTNSYCMLDCIIVLFYYYRIIYRFKWTVLEMHWILIIITTIQIECWGC